VVSTAPEPASSAPVTIEANTACGDIVECGDGAKWRGGVACRGSGDGRVGVAR
jgi:hypothetical protein